jgi:hypothetical protein
VLTSVRCQKCGGDGAISHARDECRVSTCLGERARPACAMRVTKRCVSDNEHFCLHRGLHRDPNRQERASHQRERMRNHSYAFAHYIMLLVNERLQAPWCSIGSVRWRLESLPCGKIFPEYHNSSAPRHVVHAAIDDHRRAHHLDLRSSPNRTARIRFTQAGDRGAAPDPIPYWCSIRLFGLWILSQGYQNGA